jgi:chromate reductase, NAD(P)H dehydrogenase (quinone)
MIRILAISGSLRRASSNTALLDAAVKFAPAGVTVDRYKALGDIPPFNPDLEGAEPAAVLGFRSELRAADAVLISSPEYAHGISGVLKNALDWVVGSGEFSGKPVAIFNASPRATLAQESLAEVIRTMDARLIVAAGVSVPLLGRKPDADAIFADENIRQLVEPAIRNLVAAIREN